MGPRQPSIDSNEQRKMDFDDYRDYMDQEISAGQFHTAKSGPITQFFIGMPARMNMNQEDLNLALKSRPIPVEGPIPPGKPLQKVIQVNQRHDTHDRQYRNIALICYQNTITYNVYRHRIIDVLYEIVHYV